MCSLAGVVILVFKGILDFPCGPKTYVPVSYSTIHAFPSEVITYEEWQHLKPVSRNKLSGWVKGALGTGKEMQESSNQKLKFILGTAPMWDRLYLLSLFTFIYTLFS